MASNGVRVIPAEVSDWQALRELVGGALPGPECPGLAEIAEDAGGALQFWRTRLRDMLGAERYAAFGVLAGGNTGFVSAYVDRQGDDRCVVVRHLVLRPDTPECTADRLLDAVERWGVEEGGLEVLIEVCCGQKAVVGVLAARGYVRRAGGPAAHSAVVDGQARILTAAQWTCRPSLAAVLDGRTTLAAS